MGDNTLVYDTLVCALPLARAAGGLYKRALRVQRANGGRDGMQAARCLSSLLVLPKPVAWWHRPPGACVGRTRL